MKKIMVMLLLITCNFHGMFNLTAARAQQMHRQRYAFNTHSQFGKTHFIIGHRNQQNVISDTEKSVASSVSTGLPGKKRKKSLGNSVSLLDESRSVQSFFTSRDNVRLIIATLLDEAKESILVAAFTLTDPQVAQALQRAHASGIKVEVITDYSTMNKPHSKIQDLVKANVPVFYYNHALNQDDAKKSERFMPLMHLKLIICDNKIVVNGSSNLTKAGQKGNVETISVIRDKASVNEHIKEFDHLRPLCTACQFSVSS